MSKKTTSETSAAKHLNTRLVHAGRPDPRVVTSPVFHASTVLFQDYAEFREREAAPLDREHMYYGRMGTPTTRALEDAICELDDSVGAVLSTSGTASMASILNCFLSPGDHLLMVDSVYGPTRKFCLGSLARRGVRTTFYDPVAGDSIDSLVEESTRMIFMESPGSATFEIQDVPAIVAVAKRHGLLTAIDNTWATPLLFDPLSFGVDLSMQSGTKYLNGHADCLFGVTTTLKPDLYTQLHHHTLAHGMHLAPDDANLALRGMRTLGIRLEAHDRSARIVANWLETQPRVRRLLHPAWESCPGHEIFERDFKGANGLFGMCMQHENDQALGTFVDALELFGVGFSWGGFESLCLPMQATRNLPSVPLADDETLVRLHIGLEHPDDLTADLARGFAAMDALASA
ncbi:cystathionine beta-lyase [Congregibacter sp.]|uniref:cystathionine beta-lyase n=1 Tax=Congregibacter sp. TaxID=2744308 RepID=UPI003F6AE274